MTTSLDRGLSPERAVLASGATVLVQPTSMAPAVTISATFEAGTMYDPPDRPGLAHLLARLLDRGTASRPGSVIADELDTRGVSLGFSATRHQLILSATCLSEDFEDILDLLVDMARRPTFPDEEIVLRRAERITELRQEDDNPYGRAGDALAVLLFGARHPYGRPFNGTVEGLERVTRADLLDFHSRRVVPSTLSLAIVGDVEAGDALASAVRTLEGWSAGVAEYVPVPPPLPRNARAQVTVPMPGKPQADIAYGFSAVRRLDPRYYAYWIMNNVLGEFGIGGRLADNIREREGMAYYAFSSFEATIGEGPLVIRAGVDPSRVGKAIAAIEAEVRALADQGPTPEEFEQSREYLIGSIPRLLETNRSIADLVQFAERFGLGLDYDRRLADLLMDVTVDEVRAAAVEVLDPNRACLAVAGSQDVE